MTRRNNQYFGRSLPRVINNPDNIPIVCNAEGTPVDTDHGTSRIIDELPWNIVVDENCPRDRVSALNNGVHLPANWIVSPAQWEEYTAMIIRRRLSWNEVFGGMVPLPRLEGVTPGAIYNNATETEEFIEI